MTFFIIEFTNKSSPITSVAIRQRFLENQLKGVKTITNVSTRCFSPPQYNLVETSKIAFLPFG